MEDGRPSSEDKFGQQRDPMSGTTRKEIVSGAAKKQAGGRNIISIFERYRSG